MNKLFLTLLIVLMGIIQISAQPINFDAKLSAFDNVGPTVVINQATVTLSQRPGPQPDPTTILPIEFTVIFSEPVIGFEASDVLLEGSTADISRATKVIVRNGSNYNVVIGNIGSPGGIKAAILAGSVTDSEGNPNLASTSTDNSVTYNPDYVTVSGRITLTSGRSVANAQLKLYLPNGEYRYARTNPFGYYRFNNIQTSNIFIEITSKKSIGAGVAFFLWEEITNLDITIEPRQNTSP